MNIKPQPKGQFAIDNIMPFSRAIYFWSTPEFAQEFREFGRLQKFENAERYVLDVDSRLDWIQVVNWIKQREQEINSTPLTQI